MTETIEGYVDHIVFRNQENGYTVMNVICQGEELTCVGVLPYISEGENIEAEGSFVEHTIYGKQFKIQKIELKTPEDETAIERYLGSGAIKGISHPGRPLDCPWVSGDVPAPPVSARP